MQNNLLNRNMKIEKMRMTKETMVLSQCGSDGDDYGDVDDDDDDGDDDDDRIISLDSDGKNGQHRSVGHCQLCK